MSTAQTLILGAVAGLTIFVGLPMGRIRSTSASLRASLAAVATGILVFLFWDVVSHGVAPVESHLEVHAWGAFLGYAGLLAIGFTLGMMSLAWVAAVALLILAEKVLYGGERVARVSGVALIAAGIVMLA